MKAKTNALTPTRSHMKSPQRTVCRPKPIHILALCLMYGDSIAMSTGSGWFVPVQQYILKCILLCTFFIK